MSSSSHAFEGECVNASADQPGPRFVTCRCQHCNGGIEFDAEQLSVDNNIVPCPHCGEETELHIASADEVVPVTPAQDIPTSRKHERVRLTRGTRIALTLAQCASPSGQELLKLLSDIVRDGLVTEEGVRRLNAWLGGKADSDIPAVKFLWEVSDRILRMGHMTTAKVFEMQFAIERALPKSIRGDVKERRQEAWLHSPLKPKATEAQLEYIRGLGGTPTPGLNIAEASLLIDQLLGNSDLLPTQPATEKQLLYIRDLGGNASSGLTKSDASTLIEELKGDGSEPTPRQIMILRFWNRMDLANRSKGEITEWLNCFYAENSRRKAAWELYKCQNKDNGMQHDPSWVKVGEGENCLREIAATRRLVGFIGLGIIAFLLLVWMVVKAVR